MNPKDTSAMEDTMQDLHHDAIWIIFYDEPDLNRSENALEAC